MLAVCAAAVPILGKAEHAFCDVETPLGINGWTVNEIYSGTQTSVSFDAYSNFTFYTNTAPYCPTGTGLPTANNRTFTSLANANTTFQFQPFTSNNALELNTAGNAKYGPLGNVSNPQITTGTLSLAAPGNYTSLALLNADANGASTISYTLHFAGGASATGSFAGQDWFGSGGALTTNVGRVYAAYEYLTAYGTMYTTPPNQYVYYNYSGTQPELYENDISVPAADQSLVLQSISFSMASTGGSQWSVFAVSGAQTAIPTFFYTGTDSAHPAAFDTSSLNFQQGGTPVAFSNSGLAVFDDSASGSHTISVAASGVTPNQVQFNNSSTTYTIDGPGGIGGFGVLSVTGGGTVNLNNANTYTGITNISSGTLNLNSGASLVSTTWVVGSNGVFNVSGSIPSNVNLTDNGIVNLYGNTSLASLTGNNVLNLATAGVQLTVSGGSFSGSFNGSGATLTLGGSGGTWSGNIGEGAGPIQANSVVVNSTGTWSITGSSSYSGGTNLAAGTVAAGSSSAFGVGPINLSGGLITASGPVVNLSNIITGGALVVAAGRTLELSNSANSYSGPIIIQPSGTGGAAATLKIDNAGALGTATSITVGNGGSFEVNDNSGNAGLGTSVTLSGAGVTSTYANPIPNGPTGALRGGDNATSTWAGNVNIGGPSYIESGVDGTLILTGSISGSGPVTFTGNTDDSAGATIILSPATGKANTYTGETQLLPDVNVNVTNGTLLQLGADNGISPNSGLNVVSGGRAQLVTVDLNGHNQTVKYLKGSAQTGYAITNNGATASTLTISSGLVGTVPGVLGTAIQGNIALAMNDPTGLGNQILTGANTYSGGTTLISGTLTAASATALGTGPVASQGGTLALAASLTPNTPIVTSSNFSGFTLNQGVGSGGQSLPSVSGSTLTLTTNGNTNCSNSAFYPGKVAVSDSLGFTAKFTYNVTAGYADGIAFVLQNDPRGPNAVSTPTSSVGSALGYGGTNKITNSAAVEFEIYPFGTSYGTAFGAGGLIPGDTGNPTTQYSSTAPVNIGTAPVAGGNYVSDFQPVDVTVVYNGPARTVTETLYGETEQTTFTTTYTGVDYAALVGGTSAYVGFTAGTGGTTSTQSISNFSYFTNLSAPQSIGNAIVATSGTSTIQLGITNGSTGTGANVGPITVNPGATLNVTIPAATPGRGVLFTPSVSIASNTGTFNGKLDLGSNDLVVTNSTLSQVTAMVASGYNSGAWNGSGIASSAAAAASNHLTALGVIVNDNGSGSPLYGVNGLISPTFDGSSPTDGNILVQYTYYGDANLDGQVDGSDYSRIDYAYLNNRNASNPQLTGWSNGDFNYDGVIDGSDYTLIDNAFNTQGSSLSFVPASTTAEISLQGQGATAEVPEPSSLMLVSVVSMSLLRRRTRCQMR